MVMIEHPITFSFWSVFPLADPFTSMGAKEGSNHINLNRRGRHSSSNIGGGT